MARGLTVIAVASAARWLAGSPRSESGCFWIQGAGGNGHRAQACVRVTRGDVGRPSGGGKLRPMAITAGSLSVIRRLLRKDSDSFRCNDGRLPAEGFSAPGSVAKVFLGRFRPLVGRGRPALPSPGGFRHGPGGSGFCGRGFVVTARFFGPPAVTGGSSRPPISLPLPGCWAPP